MHNTHAYTVPWLTKDKAEELDKGLMQGKLDLSGVLLYVPVVDSTTITIAHEIDKTRTKTGPPHQGLDPIGQSRYYG